MYANIDLDFAGRHVSRSRTSRSGAAPSTAPPPSLYQNGSLYGLGNAGAASQKGFTLGGLSTTRPVRLRHVALAGRRDPLLHGEPLRRQPSRRHHVAGSEVQRDRSAGGAREPRRCRSISGTPRDGSTLTTTNGYWSGTLPLTYAYQWRRCDGAGLNCTNIGGATSASYVATAADVGSTITVVGDRVERRRLRLGLGRRHGGRRRRAAGDHVGADAERDAARGLDAHDRERRVERLAAAVVHLPVAAVRRRRPELRADPGRDRAVVRARDNGRRLHDPRCGDRLQSRRQRARRLGADARDRGRRGAGAAVDPAAGHNRAPALVRGRHGAVCGGPGGRDLAGQERLRPQPDRVRPEPGARLPPQLRRRAAPRSSSTA